MVQTERIQRNFNEPPFTLISACALVPFLNSFEAYKRVMASCYDYLQIQKKLCNFHLKFGCVIHILFLCLKLFMLG